jgi:hypothetical protein
MEPRILSERVTPRANTEKLRSTEEELAYLREQVAQKERELSVQSDAFESERIAKREIAQYADVPSAKILHETVVVAYLQMKILGRYGFGLCSFAGFGFCGKKLFVLLKVWAR